MSDFIFSPTSFACNSHFSFIYIWNYVLQQFPNCHHSSWIKTCLLSEASGSLSPTAGSTTTCVMYSFRVSGRFNRERIINTVEIMTIYENQLKMMYTWRHSLSQHWWTALAGDQSHSAAGFLCVTKAKNGKWFTTRHAQPQLGCYKTTIDRH